MSAFLKLRELVAHLQEEVLILKTKFDARAESSGDFEKRLNSLRDEVHDRFAVRDELLNATKGMNESLSKQNESLHRIFGMRWNLVTGMIAFAGVALAINFGYAVYKNVEIDKQQEKLREAATELDKIRRELARLSEESARLSHSVSLLFEADQELEKNNYIDVRDYVSRAVDDLEDMIKSRGVIQTVRGIDVAGNCRSTEKPFSVQNKDRLQQAILEILVTAYDLKAKAYFKDKDNKNLIEIARSLLRLDPTS